MKKAFATPSPLSCDFTALVKEAKLNLDKFTLCTNSSRYSADVRSSSEIQKLYQVTSVPYIFVNDQMVAFDNFETFEAELKRFEQSLF